uniref:Uncharacterized protein n=1 Tax=Acrobeloides nanus TaxID=290746 RepID=A0A914CFF7_9BILA
MLVNVLVVKRFKQSDIIVIDYIAYFRENHLGSCYTRNNVRNFLANVKLTSALIQTRVRARFGLIIPSGNDEIRIFPNDLITILSTNEEDAKGVWEVEINEKQCYLHWSLLCKFCDLEENIGNHNVSRSSVYSEAISETMSLP